MKTFVELSYKAFTQQYGNFANSIIEGQKYKLLQYDGVNFIALGKCVLSEFSPGNYFNDGISWCHIKFEKNNDCPELDNIRYKNELQWRGSDTNIKLNIYIDKE
jgi:hypothetical protein